MKTLILVLALGIMNSALAVEVDTDCPAMNEAREKIVKDVKAKVAKKTKAVRQ